MTLPEDVITWLGTIQADLGRAVVALCDQAGHRHTPSPPAGSIGAEIVGVGEGRGLIVVNPALVRGLKGIAAIPFVDGRAFLALDPGWTMANLELAVVDFLEGGVPDGRRRVELAAFRARLREWRISSSIQLIARSIIVVERRPPRPRSRGRKD